MDESREPTPNPSLPGRGDAQNDIPTFDDLLDDAEIAGLLGFVPVPRAIEVVNGWTGEKQREFIARMAVHGSANKACGEMGKHRNGVDKLSVHPQGASFRAAWKAAVALARRRMAEGSPEAEFVAPGEQAPTVDHRFRLPWAPSPRPSPLKGEGEWDGGCAHCGDEFAGERRRQREHQERLVRVREKLFMARRAYLLSIADEPAARAAWELLCGPADWAAAATMQRQPDEGDPGCSDLRPLRGPGLQIPLSNGFAPYMTEPGYDPGGDPMTQFEQSVARNDPRWSGGRNR